MRQFLGQIPCCTTADGNGKPISDYAPPLKIFRSLLGDGQTLTTTIVDAEENFLWATKERRRFLAHFKRDVCPGALDHMHCRTVAAIVGIHILLAIKLII